MAKSVFLGIAMIFVALLMAPIVRSGREERFLNDHNTKTLTLYYEFINFVPVAGAPGQPRNMTTFGTVYAANPPVRQGVSLSSPQIGSGLGIDVVSSLIGNQQYVSFAVRLNSGSTMEFQGIFGDEISLVGGTGDYRCVKGYASLEPVQQASAANTSIIKSVIFYKHYDD